MASNDAEERVARLLGAEALHSPASVPWLVAAGALPLEADAAHRDIEPVLRADVYGAMRAELLLRERPATGGARSAAPAARSRARSPRAAPD